MFLKNKGVQLCIALALGLVVLLLPRPEGTKFRITGDKNLTFLQQVDQHFTLFSTEKDDAKGYVMEARNPGSEESTAAFLRQ
ncbi:MAG: anion transporter, partial [Desulfobacteraceae bacterium]